MRECVKKCVKDMTPCSNKSCRYWIEYEKDLNCCFVAVEKNGAMTLQEVGKRMSLTSVRIKQLQDEALERVRRKYFKLK